MTGAAQSRLPGIPDEVVMVPPTGGTGLRSEDLTSSAVVPTLVAMASAANEIFPILFLVARKPAC
jgi:molybdopterin biosynthesis enzyme MoaB